MRGTTTHVVRTGIVCLIICSTAVLLAATPKPGWTEAAGVRIPVPPPSIRDSICAPRMWPNYPRMAGSSPPACRQTSGITG